MSQQKRYNKNNPGIKNVHVGQKRLINRVVLRKNKCNKNWTMKLKNLKLYLYELIIRQ